MARSPDPDRTTPDDAAGSIGTAARALAEATANLTKLISTQVGSELSESLSTSLREAARGLADASATVDRHAGGKRAHERRKERVDRTRADLLAAAAKLFAERGYEGASVGDIAAEAGYTKGALYAHFGSKNDLFLELARGQLFCSDGGDASHGDLAEELSSSLAVVGEGPAMLLVLEVLAYAVRHPESRSALAPLFEDALDALARRVRDDRSSRTGQSADPDEPLTQHDRDTALGLVAVANVAALLGTLTGPDDVPRAGGRLIHRLLER